jgi:pimeloyl-ACP methyl ester carboxylesterase
MIAYDASKAALYTPEIRPPLDPAAFRWSTDALCAELSRLAYIRFELDQLPVLTTALEAHGMSNIQPFNASGTDAQGFGCVAPNGTRFIAFRGTRTDCPIDLEMDLDAFRTDDVASGGRVHRGFARCVDSLIDEINKWLGDPPHKALVITGHSLGAAMATVLAARVAEAELVTFGSPRVGNWRFARHMRRRSMRRYADCCDVVRMVPFPPFYWHIGNAEYIDRFGTLRRWSGLRRLSDRVKAVFDYQSTLARQDGNVGVRHLADHAPINYVSALLGVRQP